MPQKTVTPAGSGDACAERKSSTRLPGRVTIATPLSSGCWRFLPRYRKENMRASIKRVAGAFLCAMLLSAGVSRAGAVLPGFGAIGDSFADEYEFYPPDRNQARNFV